MLTTNICEKYPSSIRCRDSNPRPLDHESPPITTRPGLPSVALTRKLPRVRLKRSIYNCRAFIRLYIVSFQLPTVIRIDVVTYLQLEVIYKPESHSKMIYFLHLHLPNWKPGPNAINYFCVI